ncbi:MAG: TrkA C-terminal domain-containing protein, partial [Opitutaceae bacterium]
RAGLSVTPIGEFSFIIAQLGVAAAVVPKRFYPLAVGVSLLTTLGAPAVTRRSGRIADALLARQPRWLEIGLASYRGWLERIQGRRTGNLLWQLSRKRFAQVGLGMLFVTGLVLFSGRLFDLLDERVGSDWPFPHGLEIIFWAGLALAMLVPLVAVWRNLSAMALLFAQVSTKDNPREKALRPVVEACLKLGAAAGLCLWLLAILPTEGTARSLLVLIALAAVLAVLLFRRKLIFWHGEIEVGLRTALPADAGRAAAPWLRQHGEWNLHAAECLLPDLADCRGRTIAELELRAKSGCSVVGIERQGLMIALPPSETALYPRDRVLLLGTVEQIQAGKKVLRAVSGRAQSHSLFEETGMETVLLPERSPASERTLGELAPTREHGVLILGINRGGERILNPGSEERLRPGDEILVLGAPRQTRNFEAWLREGSGPAAAGGSDPGDPRG